jgi:DNA-binding NarL/FixJ family response regulator
MIRVLLADDHKLLIDGLCSILKNYPAIEIVGFAQDGLEAVELAKNLNPNIILLDISMPKLNGIEAAKQILLENSQLKVIILSMHSDKRYIQEAIKIGARGYILKESAVAEVIQAINAVQKGEMFFSQSVQDKVINEYVDMVRNEHSQPKLPLTPREKEVLQHLAEGKSTKEIAGILNVSIKTIESHRKQIMDLLNLHSIAELTKYAIREGITYLE